MKHIGFSQYDERGNPDQICETGADNSRFGSGSGIQEPTGLSEYHIGFQRTKHVEGEPLVEVYSMAQLSRGLRELRERGESVF